MKIVVGNTYRAHCFDCGERIFNGSCYHFKILDRKIFFNPITKEPETIYLAIKLYMDYSPYKSFSHCFWFDKNGLSDAEGISFKLVRKISN